MISNPLFSIITPSFNRSHLILKALDSVVAQTYRPIEVVIVDDGSSDDTRTVVNNWIKSLDEDEELQARYIRQENMGPASARNRGIAESSGKFLMFLDSDDCLYPDCLELFAVMFLRRNADIVISGCDEVNGGKVVRSHYGRPNVNQLEMVAIGKLVLMTIRIALSRKLVKKTGSWDTHMLTGEDREFFQRALSLANNPMGIHKPLSSFTRGLSDHRSYGYDQECRVQCELALLELISHRDDVCLHAVNSVISRIARIGCKLNVMGHQELAARCTHVVLRSSYALSFRVRFQLLICRAGKLGAWIYTVLSHRW